MRLRTFVSLVIVTLLASTALAIMAAPLDNNSLHDNSDPISGEWDASFYVMDTTTPFTFDLKLDGHNVTGKADSKHTGPGTLSKGTWTDNQLSFTMNFADHEAIVVTGTLKDGKLAGEFRTEGMLAKWEAIKRSATAAKSATSAHGSATSADPISGEWDAVLDAQGTQAPVSFKFKLDGDHLIGTSESEHLGAGTLTKGSWVDNKISFNIESAQMKIALTGVLKYGKLVGEFDTGQGMRGTWVATKR